MWVELFFGVDLCDGGAHEGVEVFGGEEVDRVGGVFVVHAPDVGSEVDHFEIELDDKLVVDLQCIGESWMEVG